MKIVRMYTGGDNRSHLEDVDLKFNPLTAVADGTTLLAGDTAECSIRVATQTMPELHAAPRRQYLVILEGEVDFVVGDGQKKELSAGDIVQVEDTEGEGHVVKLRPGCSRYIFFFTPLAG